MRNVFSLLATSAILIGLSSLAKAGILDVSYTDYPGNVANLVLTYTPLGGGVDEITGVTGTWGGQAITAGPVNDPYFGTLSGNLYLNPSMVPANTDSGFDFETNSNQVYFYGYNFSGSSGFAETSADLSGENYQSGAATGVTINDAPVPEPGPGLLVLTAVGLFLASRLLRRPSRT